MKILYKIAKKLIEEYNKYENNVERLIADLPKQTHVHENDELILSEPKKQTKGQIKWNNYK